YAKEGVTASDDRDGDLTSDVTVTASDVDASKAGTYHVTFSVTDAAGNTATKTITVTVTSNEKPVIVANNVSLAKGSTFDPYAYATASDAEDGDLSSKISVISNTVDTTKAGTYTVSYSVTDTDGNSVQKTIQVTITSDDKPVINAANQTVTAGDTFNPYTNVTATDAEDGDLTSKVKVLSSNVNTEVPGTYSVVYSVTDSDSNTTTKTITVTVTGAADTTKPVINASNKTLNEGDSFDPKAGVTATDDIDGNLTSKVTVTANNVDTSKAGTYNVTYRVTDTAGNTAIKTITVTVQASTTQGTITANAFTIGQDSYITGDITGGITKINMIINGKTYPAIPVSGTNYQYYANGKILSVNDTVTMVAYGANGKEFSRTNVVVKKVVVPTAGTITANDFTIGKDGYVTGNVTGDVAKVGLIVNGKALSMIPAADGSYRYYANGKILSVNDTVTVVGYDAKGKELDRANVVVKKVVVPTTGTITANDFTIGKDGYVTGNVTGDVEKVGLIVNGEELSVIPAADGSYKYYANGKILSVNDTVTVVGYDAKGKELDRTNVPVKKVVVPTAGTITVNDFTVDKDGYITGNVTGDVAKVGLIVNGKALSVIPAADGNYRYYVGNNINSVNDTATMIAYDAKGKELDRANVSIKKMETPTTGTITANDFTVGEDGYITGNVTGDVAKVGMMVNGKELSVIPAADGTYKYYVGNNIQSVNDTVTMIAYDAKGKELNRTTVRLHADNVAVGTVTAKDYTIGSSYIEGTYTGEVSSIGVIVNGKATSKTTAKNTPYQYYIANQVTSVNDDVYVVIYDVKGREMNRVKVNIQQPTDNSVGTITTNTFTIGEDNYVKGSLTGDVTRVSMVVNGEEYSKIGASGSTYQYYANGKILSVNDTVTMIAYNVNGKELDRTNVQLKKAEVVTTGTITADDFNFGGKDAYIHGATTGDVTTVKMLVNGEAASQKAVNEDGTYDYYTGSNISSANDVVEMVGYDASGKELDRTTVKLIASQGTITVEPFQVGGSDAYMHGTATGAVKKVQLIVNGVAQNLAFVQEDGTFKYYAKPVTSTSDTAVMVALDEFGQELDRQTVTLTSATGSVTANAYTVGGTDRYIHGTATGTVKKVGLEVNGVVGASQALVQADGTYQYFAGSQVTSASDKVSIIGYDANGKEIDRTDVALISN
ncbi:DUF5011 domain-containing protein, partial [Listeria sp. FSL L7-1582]|uniref:immunoglobulin-like domain-containing protein n=1 Tax=Listeria portnoyi TaxID=2713504 RepID=UPI00164D8290